jgi:hypothetical protein
MRIYIIGNDGITLSREASVTVSDGEIAVASKEELHAARRHQDRAKPCASFAARRLLAQAPARRVLREWACFGARVEGSAEHSKFP